MYKKLFLLIIILLIIPIIVRANGDEGCFGMMGSYGWGNWTMVFVPIFWIIFIGGIIFLVIKGLTEKSIQKPQEKSNKASEILKERYAKGEITKEKFESIKKDIENS